MHSFFTRQCGTEESISEIYFVSKIYLLKQTHTHTHKVLTFNSFYFPRSHDVFPKHDVFPWTRHTDKKPIQKRTDEGLHWASITITISTDNFLAVNFNIHRSIQTLKKCIQVCTQLTHNVVLTFI